MRQWEIELEESLKNLEGMPFLQKLKSDVTKTFYKKIEGLDLSSITVDDLKRIEQECINELTTK